MKALIFSNFLLLNSEETEVFVLGPKMMGNVASNQMFPLDGITLVTTSSTV